MRNTLFFLTAALLLAGCQSSDSDSGGVAGGGGGGPSVNDLCVSSDCGERIVLLELPGAENIQFSDSGRLFISSGSGLYEITKDGETFIANLLSDACGFTGLAIRNNVLYAACGSSELYAAALTPQPVPTQIFTFEGMCIPNGMALGTDGHLYVVDEPLNVCVPDPKIVRLTIDPVDPMRVLGQETWVQGSAAGGLFLGVDNVLRFPNGLVADGDSFFGTDGGSVFRVDRQADGQAGEVQPLFFEVTAHDDLGLVRDGLLVTDFFKGRILLLSREGELLQETLPLTFSFPSSVRLGRPPMFAADDILVTETGILGDQDLPLDFLSVFRRLP